MQKTKKSMVIKFLTPAIIMFLLVFLYPICRTVVMSFFHVSNITGKMDTWQFAGIENYAKLANTQVIRTSLVNLFKIWFFGGIGTICVALFFAVILNSGIYGKRFYRSAIYFPYTVSSVAVCTMFLQYVYNSKYGLLTTFFTKLGWEKLAFIPWTGVEYKFGSMLAAYCFCAVGYYMIIFSSGIENIPQDYYDAGRIDGCNAFSQFWHITFPLLKGVTKTCLIMWSIGSASFFAWSQLFSGGEISADVITPVYYLVNSIFGGSQVVTERDAGLASAVGILIGIIIVAMFVLINHTLKDDDIEL